MVALSAIKHKSYTYISNSHFLMVVDARDRSFTLGYDVVIVYVVGQQHKLCTILQQQS